MLKMFKAALRSKPAQNSLPAPEHRTYTEHADESHVSGIWLEASLILCNEGLHLLSSPPDKRTARVSTCCLMLSKHSLISCSFYCFEMSLGSTYFCNRKFTWICLLKKNECSQRVLMPSQFHKGSSFKT